MMKTHNYGGRFVSTAKTMTHVGVIDKKLLATIIQQGAKAGYPFQFAPEFLDRVAEECLIVVLRAEGACIDTFGEPLYSYGPVARCKLLIELVGAPSIETWLDMSPAMYKSLPSVLTPPWTEELPTVKPTSARLYAFPGCTGPVPTRPSVATHKPSNVGTCAETLQVSPKGERIHGSGNMSDTRLLQLRPHAVPKAMAK